MHLCEVGVICCRRFFLVCLSMVVLVSQAGADVNVLIIGSTHDSSERFGGSSAAFSPTAIETQLDSILSAADLHCQVDKGH